jgi:hypothetical protein
MSFRDVSLPREKRRGSNPNTTAAAATTTAAVTPPRSAIPSLNMVRSLSVPIAPPPSETLMDYEMAPPAKKTRPIVLHGKVLNLIDSEEMDDSGTHKAILRMQMERTVSRHEQTVRQTFERRSAFSKLTHETQQFQKLVTDLEGILEKSGESPEASWRARILIRSAQEAEKDLWDKLYKYEQSLLTAGKNVGSGSDSMDNVDQGKDTENRKRELRTSQTACMKLHRDFNRSHKVLVMILSLHQKRQKAEASRLRAVRYSDDKDINGTSNQQLHEKDEDFFDRAMREREADLERMNKSMHKVNEIYQELAALVDGQQEDIDHLDDNVLDATNTVQSSADEVNCLFERDRFCGAINLSDVTADIGYDFTERDGEERQESPFLPPKVRKGEVFDWFMPFENIGEDMESVQRDIVRMGKDILQKGEEFTCESKSSRS